MSDPVDAMQITMLQSKVARLELELEDARIDKFNAERLRDNMFTDNAILQKRIKALEANVSKSVLRRLDVQFAGQFTGGTVPTYFSEQDREKIKLEGHKIYLDAWLEEAVMLVGEDMEYGHYGEMLAEAHDAITQLETKNKKLKEIIEEMDDETRS